MSYKNTISMGKTSRCHIKIQYLCEKPLMSDKIRYLWGKIHWCQRDIQYLCEKICLIRYLWEKPLMSYKNTISYKNMGKTIDDLKDIYGKIHWCHRKIRYLWEKPSMSYKHTISKGKQLMSYNNSISMGQTIDVI